MRCKRAPIFQSGNLVKMQNSSEDDSAFSAVTRLPITPFSAFLNGNLIKFVLSF